MTTNILKAELKKAITDINDKSFLEALYTIINNRVKPFEYELSDEDIKIIEDRQKAYKTGKLKGMTMSEVRKKVVKKLSE